MTFTGMHQAFTTLVAALFTQKSVTRSKNSVLKDCKIRNQLVLIADFFDHLSYALRRPN